MWLIVVGLFLVMFVKFTSKSFKITNVEFEPENIGVVDKFRYSKVRIFIKDSDKISD